MCEFSVNNDEFLIKSILKGIEKVESTEQADTIELKNALLSVRFLLNFLDTKGNYGESRWLDKNNNQVYMDTGYFYEGLINLKKYLEQQIAKKNY